MQYGVQILFAYSHECYDEKLMMLLNISFDKAYIFCIWVNKSALNICTGIQDVRVHLVTRFIIRI